MITLNYASTKVWDRELQQQTFVSANHEYEIVAHEVKNFKEFFACNSRLREFDLIEFSLSGYLRSSREFRRQWQLLPVATSRSFRFQSAFTLEGASIGEGVIRVVLPTVGMTASIWIAEYLHRWAGIRYSDIEWVELESLVHSQESGHERASSIPGVSRVGSQLLRTLEHTQADLAIVTNVVPHMLPGTFEAFPGPSMDHAEEVLAWAGGVPVMHMVLLRRDRAQSDDSLAGGLARLYESARVRGSDLLHNQDFNRINLPTDLHDYRRLHAAAGDEPYSNAPGSLFKNIRACHTILGELGFDVEPEIDSYFTDGFFG